MRNFDPEQRAEAIRGVASDVLLCGALTSAASLATWLTVRLTIRPEGALATINNTLGVAPIMTTVGSFWTAVGLSAIAQRLETKAARNSAEPPDPLQD